MEFVHLTVQQMFIMLLYLLLGYLLCRTGVLSAAGSREIAAMLVKLIIPAVIINSFCTSFSVQRLLLLAQGFALSAAALLLAMAAARLLFRRYPLENFSAAFSNAGFMGIPMVQAVLGSEAVLYIAPFVALLNLLQWTYGVDVICEKRSPISLRQIFWNPPMVAIGIGLVLFVTGAGTALPAVLAGPLTGLAALNSPLAMIVLGIYLARETPASLFSSPRLYLVSAARLIAIPLLTLVLLWLLPAHSQVALAVMVCAAAPVGANVAVYAQLHGKDHAYASKIVVVSTLLSLITLPVMTIISQRIFL